MAAHRIAAAIGLLVVCPFCRADAIPSAYVAIAAEAGVPPQVLYATALVESGTALEHGVRPWPWTLNVAGTPMRFSSHDAACQALLTALHEVGAKRVDAGIGQTNLGYHPERYAVPCDALDPYQNLKVTAELLKLGYQVRGNWTAAAGHFHRPAGGAPAARYRALFSTQLAKLSPISTGAR